MNISLNVDLTDYNSYRLRAGCSRAFFPDTEDDFIEIFREYPDTSKQVIGSGHNIILADEWYDIDFVILNGNFNQVEVHGSTMWVQAGAFSEDISRIALQHSLSGLEFLYDIPSSLGGAIVMNAGASGEEIKDVLVKVRYLDLSDLQIKEVGVADAAMSYRSSIFHQRCSKYFLDSGLWC